MIGETFWIEVQVTCERWDATPLSSLGFEYVMSSSLGSDAGPPNGQSVTADDKKWSLTKILVNVQISIAWKSAVMLDRVKERG